MATFQYAPKGVCCRQIELEIEGDNLQSVKFYGGCDGNLQGISRLVQGQNIDHLANTLCGIDCRGKGTSCPDQLAKALQAYREL